MRDRILHFLTERGSLAEPDAIAYLLKQEDPLASVAEVLRSFQEPPFVITLDDIVRAGAIGRAAASRVAKDVTWQPTVPQVGPPTRVEASVPATFRHGGTPATDIAEDLRILKDITGRSTCEGTSVRPATVIASLSSRMRRTPRTCWCLRTPRSSLTRSSMTR